MRLQLIVYDESGGKKKARTRRSVEKQQNSSGQKDAESEQAEDCCYEPAPNSKRHAEQSHSRSAQINRSGDEIQRAQKGRQAEKRDAYNPQRLSHTFAGPGYFTHAAERRVAGP